VLPGKCSFIRVVAISVAEVVMEPSGLVSKPSCASLIFLCTDLKSLAADLVLVVPEEYS
jgi:hypothetical protein